MEIERIEDWVGREVHDVDGNKLGKLDEVYFDGDEAVAGEVKPGLLTRKRIVVPLHDAGVARDSLTVSGTFDGPTDHLETGASRSQRLADIAEAEAREREAQAEVARRKVDAEDAAKHAQELQEAAAAAEEERRVAAARVERLRERGPGETAT